MNHTKGARCEICGYEFSDSEESAPCFNPLCEDEIFAPKYLSPKDHAKASAIANFPEIAKHFIIESPKGYV